MPVRTANAEWKGTLKDGRGTVKTETGSVDSQYSFSSRFESGTGTNPEELIAAAHSGCFSMALAGNIVKAGFTPRSIRTSDQVFIDKIPEGGFRITKIETTTEADVPGIDKETLQRLAEDTKKTCPVSMALRGTELILKTVTLNS